MRSSDWSSDVCSSDLLGEHIGIAVAAVRAFRGVGRVHEDDGAARTHHQIERAIVPEERGDIVDEVRAGGERGVHHARLAGVDRDRRARGAQALDDGDDAVDLIRSEEHTSELKSLIRLSYAVFCLTKKIHASYRCTSAPTQAC